MHISLSEYIFKALFNNKNRQRVTRSDESCGQLECNGNHIKLWEEGEAGEDSVKLRETLGPSIHVVTSIPVPDLHRRRQLVSMFWLINHMDTFLHFL